MRASTLNLFVLIALLLTPRMAEGAEFQIDEWFLGTVVRDFTSGASDGEVSGIVQNGFMESHFASLPPNGLTFAETSFGFSWTDRGFGDFLIQASHAAENLDNLRTQSSGNIIFTTTVDLRMDIDASYTYDVGDKMVRLNFNIIQQDPVEILFAASERGGAAVFEPPAGTLTIQQDDLLVPAGHTYAINYLIDIITFGDPPDTIGTGSGFIHFSIEPVPEPSTLFLVAVGSLGLSRRRTKPHTQPSL